jgi:outer membrane receptor for ferrienterochelin and colicin
MKTRLLISILLFVIALAGSSYTYGQEPSDLSNLSLEQLLNIKITTVSKTSERAGQAPASVVVVTAKQINTRRYRNLAEILNDLQDVKVNDKSDPQVFNTFSIRGITRQDKFVILIDGIKISSPVNDQLPILENFPIYLAKQIEIAFGPGSALYGADAMAGVINIITEKGAGNDVLEASARAGTYGYNSQYMLFKKSFRTGMNLTAGGQYTYDRQPDFSKVYPSEYNMSAQQTGVFNSVYGPMQPSKPVQPDYSAPVKTYNMYLSLNKGGFDFKFLHHYSAVPTSTTLRPDNGVYNKDVFYGQGLTSASISYEDSIGLLKSMTLLQGSFSQVNPGSNFRNVYGRMEHGYKYSHGSMIKTEQQFNYMVSRKLQAIGGVTYEIFKSLPKSVELAAPQSRSGAVEGTLLNSADYYNPSGIAAKFYTLLYNNVGSFLQLQYNPVKKLAATLGVRYDHNSRFGSSTNPRVGLVYNHSAKTTLKALYGTAYWAPSPHVTYEQYGSFYSMDSGRTYASDFWHLPNPNLKPTTSETFELSLNQRVTKHLNFTLTGYYTHLHGLINGVLDNGNTELYNNRFLGYAVSAIEVPVNAGTQTNYGGNLAVNSIFDIGNCRFNGWSSISFVDGTVMEYATPSKLTEVEIPLIAPWQFRAGIDATSGNFSYSVRMLRSGKQRVTGFVNRSQPHERQQIPGYTLVNASVSYMLKNKFSFFVTAQNLLNYRYRNVLPADRNDSSSATFLGSNQDPRRIMGGITVTLR